MNIKKKNQTIPRKGKKKACFFYLMYRFYAGQPLKEREGRAILAGIVYPHRPNETEIHLTPVVPYPRCPLPELHMHRKVSRHS